MLRSASPPGCVCCLWAGLYMEASYIYDAGSLRLPSGCPCKTSNSAILQYERPTAPRSLHCRQLGPAPQTSRYEHAVACQNMLVSRHRTCSTFITNTMCVRGLPLRISVPRYRVAHS
jgi:hypothetical protein